MKQMGIKEKILAAVLMLATVWAVAYSADCLFVKGILSWHIRQKEFLSMMAEVSVLFVLFTAVLRWAPSRRGMAAGIAVVMSAFLWVHVAFLPIVVSGLYVWYLCAVGGWIRSTVCKTTQENEYFRDFLLGSMAVICLFCIMSAVGVGSILHMQLAVAGSGDVLAGMIGAFLAQGMQPEDACCCAVYLHGLAGRHVAETIGEVSSKASDIIQAIPDILMR